MNITQDDLIAQYEHLHSSKQYRWSGARSAMESITLCLDELKPSSVLEYGCGQSRLFELLGKPGMTYDRYDPAIPEIATVPRRSYDFVFSTDVLEHIPTEDVPDVLAHIRQLSPTVFLRISTRPARTILQDGRNAHLTVWPGEQWLQEIRNHFPEAELVYELTGEKCIIMTWKSASAAQIAKLENTRDKKRRGALRRFFKGIERSLRSLRDSLAGRRKSR